MYVIARIRLATTKPVQTKSGTRMQSGFGFADVGEGDDLPCGLVAFNNLADTLAKYKKGDTIRVSGDFHHNDYTDKKGNDVNGWQITIEGIAGVKNATGKYNQPKAKATSEAIARQTDFYDDTLSF